MCGIGTGKSQSPGKPQGDPSSAQTLAGTLELNSAAPPAAAARPKKLRRDNAAISLEVGEVLFIPYVLLAIRFLSNFVKWEVGRSSIREHALSNRRPQDPWKLLMGPENRSGADSAPSQTRCQGERARVKGQG